MNATNAESTPLLNLFQIEATLWQRLYFEFLKWPLGCHSDQPGHDQHSSRKGGGDMSVHGIWVDLTKSREINGKVLGTTGVDSSWLGDLPRAQADSSVDCKSGLWIVRCPEETY